MSAVLAALKNPWVLLAIACVAGIGGTGWYRMRWLSEVAAREQDVARAEEAARQAQEADARHTKELSDQLAAEIAARKEQANARTIAIAQAPVTNTCVASPAMRALFDGLRHRPDQASAGQPPDPGRAGAAVSR